LLPSALRKREGAGKAGSSPPPWPACRKECRRQVPQVQPRHPGLPCAMVLTAASLSPRCAGLLATVARVTRERQRKRNTSIGVSGPRDLTVRAGSFVGAIDHAAIRHAHRIPLPTSVTTAIRPLRRNGTGATIMLILRNRQAIYLYPKGWTGFCVADRFARWPDHSDVQRKCARELRVFGVLSQARRAILFGEGFP